MAVEDVHFHEVGAVDSIVDIVAAVMALESLGVDAIHCSAVPLGGGTVETAHGELPVPAPATVQLLVGARTSPGAADEEMTTPTAAAILTTLTESFGPAPDMELTAVGCGAGDREFGPLPNLLRVLLGRASEAGTTDSVVELSANIDDCTGEILGATIETLLAAGCLDAWATPIHAKKSRPAWMLTALAAPADVDEAERILFRETTTFGIRRRIATRSKLARSIETVETPFGPIRVKVGRRGGQVVTASPEFSDCRGAAEAHAVCVADVLRTARETWSGKQA
jgi:uncharacterized protein (TIGR00299 family) protein